MPQVKCIIPKTLTHVCIEFIVRNIELWCKQTVNDLQIIGPGIGDNPFDQLPCVILEQIVRKNRKDENTILQHLLTPQLTSLTVSDRELVQLASIRCPLMKNLTLSNTNLNFFPKFEKLQELTFSLGGAEDSFLHVIGTYCTNLRKLDLRCCRRVTDYGIQGLCVSVDNLERKCETLGRCKSLQSLNLEYKTGVTKIGLKVALENMPALRILDHDATLEVLAEIAQNPLNQTLSGPPKFVLSMLRLSYDTPYKSGDFRLAYSLCPSVTILRIEETDGFSDMDLVSLRALESLRELKIYANSNIRNQIQSKITFDGGVAPLMKAIGTPLKMLELCSLNSVNIRTIIECCPNLVGLRLIDNNNYNGSYQEVQKSVIFSENEGTPIFEKLKTLNIEILQISNLISTSHHFKNPDIPRGILVCLLSSPLLREIEIVGCEMLTDCVLLAVAKLHHFKNLEKLFLQYCHNITKEGIDVFMRDGNALKEIDLTKCMNVSSVKNAQFWINLAKKKNWEFSIYCTSSDTEIYGII